MDTVGGGLPGEKPDPADLLLIPSPKAGGRCAVSQYAIRIDWEQAFFDANV
jgi:hypothetical protein